MMYKFAEIRKLDKMLDNARIPHELQPYMGGFVLAYPSIRERTCFVTQTRNSLGGPYDLLELQGLLTKREAKVDKSVGAMTAAEIYERIVKHWKEKENEPE